MSTLIYHDADADLVIVQAKRLAFIGYGNQGAAQAQNLRDNGVSEMLIGNREESYKEAALASGFQVVSIPEAAAWCDVVFLLRSALGGCHAHWCAAGGVRPVSRRVHSDL